MSTLSLDGGLTVRYGSAVSETRDYSYGATYATAAHTIDYSVAGGVCTITFNRPDSHNAFTPGMFRRYLEALARAEADPDARAIVVTGAGGTFSPGADAVVLLQGKGGEESLREFRAGTGYPPHYPLTVRKPMIAAIERAAAGLGFVVAAWCDVRFAAEGTKFATSFTRRGLIAEYGIGWLLPRLIGHGHALDLLLSGRTIDAGEAHRMGLVQRLVTPGRTLAAATDYARDLAVHSSPMAMAVVKQQVLLDASRDAAAAAEDAVRLMHESLERPDFAEGVASYLEKRPPAFLPYAASPALPAGKAPDLSGS